MTAIDVVDDDSISRVEILRSIPKMFKANEQ